MSYRKKDYKNVNKWRETVTNHNRRYYAKTAIYRKRPWTPEEDACVISHDIPDRELSAKIERSMRAISVRRHRLKYGLC